MTTHEEKDWVCEAVLRGIINSLSCDGSRRFGIEIQNAEMVERWDGYAIIGYAWWQDADGEAMARISTASFHTEPGAPDWLARHGGKSS